MSEDLIHVLERAGRAAAVAAAHADAVDREGRFPAEALAALREEGLLGLLGARDLGGLGHGHRAAALVVERLARECGSTAMVLCMHYAGAHVLDKHAPAAVRAEVATGRHLSTLAFSEAGSRSQFWSPVGTATPAEGGVRLDARKSWVTSAGQATAYVWSSRPLAAEGASTIWLVPRQAEGLSVAGPFDGLGLRGNDSAPVVAEGVVVPESARLGPDGGGLAVMLEVVLPLFNLLNAACSIGQMEAAIARTVEHAGATRFEHQGSALRELPTIRAQVARMRIAADMARALWEDAIAAVEAGRPEAPLKVLEVKAGASEAALEVTDAAMRVCGGAAFRREVGVERRFRDARAASVMAPTTDALYEFIGRALCGLPLL